jgi:transposase
MTYNEKRLLIDLIRRGKSAKEIPSFVWCSKETIRKYIKIFRSSNIKLSNNERGRG